MNLLKTQLGRLRILAFVEGLSFLAILFVTMPLKYFYGMPEPNKIIGMLHGVLFIAYVYAVIQITLDEKWNMKKMSLSLLASIIPFGTFWADHVYFKPDMIDV